MNRMLMHFLSFSGMKEWQKKAVDCCFFGFVQLDFGGGTHTGNLRDTAVFAS